MMRTIAVTGASGYLGKHLINRCLQRGCSIRALGRTRRQENSSQVEDVFFDLSAPVSSETLNGADILIHLAHDFSGLSLKDSLKINFEGSRRLFLAAKEGGVRTIIFISSMAAYPGCRSVYGRAKLAIEEEAIKFGAWVIRPGTVYGGSNEGLFAGLRAMATKHPFIPLIDGGRQQLFLVHVDDLCEALLKIAFDDSLTAAIEPLSLAGSRPCELREILVQLAQQAGKKSHFLYVPSLFLLPAMKLAESIGIKLPFRSDSLVSIRNRNPNARIESDFLGIKLREYAQSS
jgi:nucleoside-diphosphate-sugar epimerase